MNAPAALKYPDHSPLPAHHPQASDRGFGEWPIVPGRTIALVGSRVPHARLSEPRAAMA